MFPAVPGLGIIIPSKIKCCGNRGKGISMGDKGGNKNKNKQKQKQKQLSISKNSKNRLPVKKPPDVETYP
jgi:hypothetical protein